MKSINDKISIEVKDILYKGKYSYIFILFGNFTEEEISLSETDFYAIDKDTICVRGERPEDDEIENKGNFYYSGYYHVQPKSKSRYLVCFRSQKDSICTLLYNCSYISKLNVSICEDNLLSNLDEKISDLLKEIDHLKNEIIEKDNRIQELEEKLPKEQTTNQSTGLYTRQRDIPIKYEIKEDDDYVYVFSLEEDDLISFNREFDKSKSNYNWVNEGEPLIKVRLDFPSTCLRPETRILSPTSGIFEYNKNKSIAFKEEVCRIRKYEKERKNDIIEAFEREEIKQNIYKRERKKMIERETLDELITEGKIFNVYTKKDGNRTAIPMDIASAVWNRDGGRCCICGSNEKLEFDHIIPISKGGATTFRNLQLLCEKCNREKSNKIG